MRLDVAMEERSYVLRTVVAASALAFGLDTLLAALDRELHTAEVLGRLILYPIFVLVYLGIGWFLGRIAWPRLGARLTRRIVRRRIASKKLIFICDRPDAPRSIPRRIWEVVGFAAGVSVLGIAVLRVLDPPSAIEFPLLLFLPFLALVGAFVIVPYWMLASLGLRIVDPVRWTVIPVGRRYAERAKLSNGALVLLGAGALINILFRAGASGVDAVTVALELVLRTVASILVIAAAAVAYYHRIEFGLSHTLELEAVAMGVRDGRGMSDGDFLPRLPPVKKA